jgi:hypothetical protein
MNITEWRPLASLKDPQTPLIFGKLLVLKKHRGATYVKKLDMNGAISFVLTG